MTTVVFSGGPLPNPTIVGRLPSDRFVIAADAGLDHAHALGIAVDLLVGDLDSVSPDLIEHAGRVERHQRDKDATDLDLALRAALGRGEHTIVVTSDHGRFDHLAAELTLLASPRWARLELEAWFGAALVLPVHGGQERELAGESGWIVTLLALGGPVHGVITKGLRWPLIGATLDAGSSLGVSNEFTGDRATVRVGAGGLLVIIPASPTIA